MLARVAGTIYTEAVSHGVPHSLAQEMVQDYWIREMHPGAVEVTEGEARRHPQAREASKAGLG
ncbi:hypothetical protein [Streptomyces sp. NBC_01363]|uniref:hypothetical protein n=1 Tax=Streptomyces sp. NBC_01363 TaxID=2903840 RepID=UPI0022534EC9|nr:hypothetical protein [Streptomyces sp. NBC_01363]MCX4729793.1 hypothetical protein [Streptomyces sp. NBC_01363]